MTLPAKDKMICLFHLYLLHLLNPFVQTTSEFVPQGCFGQLKVGSVYNVLVNASRVVSSLEHFWESTGFCPPDPHQGIHRFILSEDEAQNIAYIGSVPNQGIKQVRIHWLLDLITMKEAENGNMEYNFMYLDEAMDLLIRNRLKPGFELMGNPSNYFSDFDDLQQILAWKDLVTATVQHLVGQYGEYREI